MVVLKAGTAPPAILFRWKGLLLSKITHRKQNSGVVESLSCVQPRMGDTGRKNTVNYFECTVNLISSLGRIQSGTVVRFISGARPFTKPTPFMTVEEQFDGGTALEKMALGCLWQEVVPL